MSNGKNKKILTSKQETMDYIGCSYHPFKKYMESGLPARYEEGRWLSHTDNVDEFFKTYTRVSMKTNKREVEGNLQKPP